MDQEKSISAEEATEKNYIVVQEIIKETYVEEPMALVHSDYGYKHDERPEILALHEQLKWTPNTRVTTRFRNVLRNDMENYRVIKSLKIGSWDKLDGSRKDVFLKAGDIVKLFYRNPGEKPIEYYVFAKWSGYDWQIACGNPDIFDFEHFLEHFVTFHGLQDRGK